MNQFVISIMSRDRVGIVRDVATRIAALQGDIADLRQRVLRGYFTMILLAAFPSGIDSSTIRHRLSAINAHSDTPLEITITPVTDLALVEDVANRQQTYMLTAAGQDRIGFVAAVTGFCADNQVNILDLSTTVDGGQYLMILQVDLSLCPSVEAIYRQLAQFSANTGIHATLQHDDIFQAMHEINMP